MYKSFIVFTALSVFSLTGLNGCAKKKFEDTDTYRELMRRHEETDKKMDSIKKENYKQLTDSTNSNFKRSMDSLKHITDSLREKLNKNIESLKK